MNQNPDNSNSNNNEKNPFSLPEGYFNSFSQKMMLKIELADEIKEFKLLSSIDKTLPFVTPQNYFAQSSRSVEVKAELSTYETLSGIRKTNAFVLPPHYLEHSAKTIENKIELTEELQQYVTLSSIEKKNTFNVPQGYFDTVSEAVREKIHANHNEQPVFGKVIQLVFSKRTAYALAAMMVLSLGLYFYNSNNDTTDTCNGLACLDKNEILNSNQITTMDEESLMNLVDPEQLSKNLKKATEKSDNKEEAGYVLENADVNDL